MTSGFYRNAEFTDSVNIRAVHTLLIIIVTFLFASSLGHLLIAGAPGEEIAGAFAMLVSIMLYAFCGVLAGPSDLPRFWIFMYRVSFLSEVHTAATRNTSLTYLHRLILLHTSSRLSCLLHSAKHLRTARSRNSKLLLPRRTRRVRSICKNTWLRREVTCSTHKQRVNVAIVA